MNLLEGKTAIITGGTRGIGFGIAKKFLENGANVAVCGSRQSSVDKALAEFAELGYTDAVMGIVPDLSDPASIDAEFAKVVERFGRLDNLVALADCYSTTLDELVGRSSPVRTAPSARTADTESLLREEPPRDRFFTLKNGLIGLAAVLVPFAILLGLALKGGAWSTWALVIGGATGTVLLGRALYSGLSSLREGIARAWHELLDALR